MMKDLIAGFPAQLQEALTIGQAARLRRPDREISNILVSGLGGSGIGASLVAELIAGECPLPFAVNKGYTLPAYVDSHSLVIISSYSGNTEETLMAMQDALDKGAYVVCITSGGKVRDIAIERNLDHIIIPGGNPPRACLGYSLVQQLVILQQYGYIGDSILNGVARSIGSLQEQQDQIRTEAESLAAYLVGKLPVLYTTDRLGSVAVRYRQQINENAKMLCWHHVLPELNHNELMGWRDENDGLAVLFLRHQDDFERNQQRIELTKHVIGKYTPHVRELWSVGDSDIEKALYLIHLTDWSTWYMAELRHHDAMEIAAIDFLKNELAKQPL